MFKPGQTEAWTEVFLRTQPRFLPATLADRVFASQILPEAILKHRLTRPLLPRLLLFSL